ncbi:MAG: hypothetical protein AB2813_15255 [Candidatus Sedimenticola endophacoides]
MRNLRSVGLDLQPHQASGRLMIHSGRAIEMGLEEHLISIMELIGRESPQVLVLDPVSALMDMGSSRQVKMLMIRFISHIKGLGVTLVLSELWSRRAVRAPPVRSRSSPSRIPVSGLRTPISARVRWWSAAPSMRASSRSARRRSASATS